MVALDREDVCQVDFVCPGEFAPTQLYSSFTVLCCIVLVLELHCTRIALEKQIEGGAH